MRLPDLFQKELAYIAKTFANEAASAQNHYNLTVKRAEDARASQTETLVKATDFMMRNGYIEIGTPDAPIKYDSMKLGAWSSVSSYLREVAREINRPFCLIKPRRSFLHPGKVEFYLEVPNKVYCSPLYAALDVVYESLTSEMRKEFGFDRDVNSHRRYYNFHGDAKGLLATWKKNIDIEPEFRKALGLPEK